jgi:hypothetical protein
LMIHNSKYLQQLNIKIPYICEKYDFTDK